MKFNNDFNELDLSVYTEDELARLNRLKWYDQAMRLRTLEKEELMDELFSIDIRVLTYLFLCANPDITQGEFARRIGTNPVALSRAINTDRFIIKSEWIKDIEDLLANFDLSSLIQKIQTIHEIQIKVQESKRRECIANIISAHYGFKEFDELTGRGTYWTIFTHSGAISFVDTESRTEWVFWDNDTDDSFDDPFDFLTLYLKNVANGKASIVTSDIRSYDLLVRDYVQKKPQFSGSEEKPYRSIILVDIESEQFIREHILA